MADSGEIEVVPVGGGALESEGLLNLSKDGDLGSPKFRRSERRKSTRSFSARGRLAKASPKSLLMRMVEMRKGGLRGRELRLSSLKGSGSKASKGLKGSAGGGLVAPLVGSEDDEGLKKGMEGEGCVSGVAGVAGCAEQGDRFMEEAGVGEGLKEVLLGEDAAGKVLVDLPQGAYVEGGRVLAVEDLLDDSEKRIECVGAPLLVTNESALMLAEMDNALDL